MTPEALHALSAVSTLIERMGTWPIGTIVFAAIIGPWVFSYIISRQNEKRFEEVRQMYENNAKLSESFDRLTRMQQDIISLNTAKWSEAIDKIDMNQFCPLNRIKKKRMEDIHG